MTRFDAKSVVVLGFGVLLLSSLPGLCRAETVARVFLSSAAGICQSSYPATAGGLLRARPLALQNEGATSTFVTCSYPTPDLSEAPNWAGLGLVFVNNGTGNVNVTCTLVSGTLLEGNVVYLPKTRFVTAGSVDVFIQFEPDELPGSPEFIARPNLSCVLPPEIGIQHLWYQYDREIGL